LISVLVVEIRVALGLDLIFMNAENVTKSSVIIVLKVVDAQHVGAKIMRKLDLPDKVNPLSGMYFER
jgi:hypothetical protein